MKRVFIFLLTVFFSTPIFARDIYLTMKDLTWTEFILFDKSVKLFLPEKPDKFNGKYEKVLMDKYYGWAVGHIDKSGIKVRSLESQFDDARERIQEEQRKYRNKILVEIRIDHHQSSAPMKFRWAYVYGENPIFISLTTWTGDSDYKNESQKQERIREDDAIFEKAISEITLQLPDGKWVHPEIVRIPVKVIEPQKQDDYSPANNPPNPNTLPPQYKYLPRVEKKSETK